MCGVRKNSVPDCSTKKGGVSASRLVQCRPSISIRINFYPYVVTSLDPSSRNVALLRKTSPADFNYQQQLAHR
jgi:hypothetical protein